MNAGQTERKFCTSAEWAVWEAEQRAAEKPAKKVELPAWALHAVREEYRSEIAEDVPQSDPVS